MGKNRAGESAELLCVYMIQPKPRYFILNKPANMVSQFVSPDPVGLLGDLDYDFPEGTHAIGRLDSHSEGLLLLTTNKKVTRLLFQSEVPHKRTYLVQVKNVVSEQTLDLLRSGIPILIKGNVWWRTTPCEVQIVEKPEGLISRYAERDDVPHSWLRITLTEGKYHQVRKMVYTAGHRCQRLIRISIEDMVLDGLKPGEVRELEEAAFFQKLKIDNWR